jgi:pyruvate dehydrogenase phosphatase
LLTEYLLHYVTQELVKVAPNMKAQDPNSAAPIVDHAIKKAFIKLDDDMMSAAVAAVHSDEPFATKISQLIPGYAGSCALLSFFDPESRLLRVACTGDSRAVFGQKSSDGSWQTIPLSVDQNGKNPDELARLQREHPDEPNMVKGKRLLGLAVTRAFGDGRWKWDQETQEVANKKFNGPKVRPDYKTPPYLTAEPVITTREVEMDKPSFLIMASDGLWDHMSSEQAVMLVGKWIEWTTAGRPRPTPPTTAFDNFDLSLDWQVNEKTVTTQDENVAVHLVRNALGGANHDILSGVLAFQPPLSRNARDDITVQVIFFGDGKSALKL